MQYLVYRERRFHGSTRLPVGFYQVNSSHPRYAMQFHWHVECELIRILDGTLYLTLDDQHFLAKPGDVFFIGSGVLHGGTPNNCVYECIVFDAEKIFRREIPFAASFIEGNLQINVSLGQYPDLAPLLLELYQETSQKKTGYELIVHSLFNRMLSCIQRNNYYDNVPRDNKHYRIVQCKSALKLIEQEYQRKLSLDDLAKQADMSPKYFCLFFREMTGYTPIDYLNRYRIEQACALLLTTELSITDIAYECGFNDLSYFIRTFKKYKNVSPKKYLASL